MPEVVDDINELPKSTTRSRKRKVLESPVDSQEELIEENS